MVVGFALWAAVASALSTASSPYWSRVSSSSTSVSYGAEFHRREDAAAALALLDHEDPAPGRFFEELIVAQTTWYHRPAPAR